MYHKLKFLHILGIVMFFGSILSHIVIGVVSGKLDDPEILVFARTLFVTEGSFLAIPGLVIFTITGIGMMALRKLPVNKLRWLGLHMGLGIVVIINTLVFLMPLDNEILAAANDFKMGTATLDSMRSLETKQAIFGAVNVLCCLLITAFGVIKPRFQAQA